MKPGHIETLIFQTMSKYLKMYLQGSEVGRDLGTPIMLQRTSLPFFFSALRLEDEISSKNDSLGFSGCPVATSTCQCSGDMHSTPGLGRILPVIRQLSLWSHPLEPVLCKQRSHHNEKSELPPQLEKDHFQQQRPKDKSFAATKTQQKNRLTGKTKQFIKYNIQKIYLHLKFFDSIHNGSKGEWSHALFQAGAESG